MGGMAEYRACYDTLTLTITRAGDAHIGITRDDPDPDDLADADAQCSAYLAARAAGLGFYDALSALVATEHSTPYIDG